jgi:NAD dependent epimerase/dehydratase family enzyme
VLSKNGGALVEMGRPIRLGVGAPLGTGKQYLSWIHIDDLCAMFIKAVEDEHMQGAYNAVCDWVTNDALTRAIAKELKRLLWLPPVPGFVMRIVVGEMSVIVVNGSKISSEKIRRTGFDFQFDKLDNALKNLLK